MLSGLFLTERSISAEHFSEKRKGKNIIKVPLVSVHTCIFQCISRINAMMPQNWHIWGALNKQWGSSELRIKLRMQVVPKTSSTLTSAHTAVVSRHSHFLHSRGLNGRDSSTRGLTNSNMRAKRNACNIPVRVLVTQKCASTRALCTVPKCNLKRSKCLKTKTAPWESRLKYQEIFQKHILALFSDINIHIYILKGSKYAAYYAIKRSRRSPEDCQAAK